MCERERERERENKQEYSVAQACQTGQGESNRVPDGLNVSGVASIPQSLCNGLHRRDPLGQIAGMEA